MTIQCWVCGLVCAEEGGGVRVPVAAAPAGPEQDQAGGRQRPVLGDPPADYPARNTVSPTHLSMSSASNLAARSSAALSEISTTTPGMSTRRSSGIYPEHIHTLSLSAHLVCGPALGVELEGRVDVGTDVLAHSDGELKLC